MSTNRSEGQPPPHLPLHAAITRLTCEPSCYDMEVGENRVRVFYGTEKREKEKNSRYIREASAPAAEPCIRPVTCLQHMYTSNTSSPLVQKLSARQIVVRDRVDICPPQTDFWKHIKVTNKCTKIFCGELDTARRLGGSIGVSGGWALFMTRCRVEGCFS
jgi:hypothetical protein